MLFRKSYSFAIFFFIFYIAVQQITWIYSKNFLYYFLTKVVLPLRIYNFYYYINCTQIKSNQKWYLLEENILNMCILLRNIYQVLPVAVALR